MFVYLQHISNVRNISSISNNIIAITLTGLWLPLPAATCWWLCTLTLPCLMVTLGLGKGGLPRGGDGLRETSITDWRWRPLALGEEEPGTSRINYYWEPPYRTISKGRQNFLRFLKLGLGCALGHCACLGSGPMQIQARRKKLCPKLIFWRLFELAFWLQMAGKSKSKRRRTKKRRGRLLPAAAFARGATFVL